MSSDKLHLGNKCFQEVLEPITDIFLTEEYGNTWVMKADQAVCHVDHKALPRDCQSALKIAEELGLQFATEFLKRCSGDYSDREQWLEEKRSEKELERYNYPTY